jgi:RNA polymerase sigma factor (sigma-70 family)
MPADRSGSSAEAYSPESATTRRPPIMMPVMDDAFAELLARVRAGDAEAIGTIVSRNESAVRAFVRLNAGGLIRRVESCSDLVQTVLREALQHMAGVEARDEAAFRRWLLGVTLNKIRRRREYYVAQKRDIRRNQTGASERLHELLRSYGDVVTPSRSAEAREEVERIERAFDGLSEADRDIILQVRILGRGYAEIARGRGVSQDGVRQQLSRARARLGMILANDA